MDERREIKIKPVNIIKIDSMTSYRLYTPEQLDEIKFKVVTEESEMELTEYFDSDTILALLKPYGEDKIFILTYSDLGYLEIWEFNIVTEE